MNNVRNLGHPLTLSIGSNDFISSGIKLLVGMTIGTLNSGFWHMVYTY